MGEDRTTCTEKKPNEVAVAIPHCRHRHSSVISSCSEDAESESTSGYPPSDDEREEELEYGPGIVNKLRTRFLTISLKQTRGTNIRRSCSMENLLEQDRPCRLNNTFPVEKNLGVNGIGCTKGPKNNQLWGNLKRAKSMDTLLSEMNPDMQPAKELRSEVNGKDVKQPIVIKRQDGGLNRAIPTICDEELPKPDTVKTYKRMFEPAESRRGSHCRRPPVLRASAKSCAASKANGIISSPSAKVNGTATKSKFSAKPISPIKAQFSSDIPSPPNGNIKKSVINGEHVANIKKPVTNGEIGTNLKKPLMNGESITNGKKSIMNGESVTSGKKPVVNGESSRPLYNGCHIVKATPVKISTNSIRNGKDVEKNLNSINRLLNKKEVHFAPKSEIICNGNISRKEALKIKTPEEIVKPLNKHIGNGIDTVNFKPKVPPNRPSLKPPKSLPKFDDKKSDKIVLSKLKSNIVNGCKKTFEADSNDSSKSLESNCQNELDVNQENKSNNEISLLPENKRIDEIQNLEEIELKDVVKSPLENKEELKFPFENKPIARMQKVPETAVKEGNHSVENETQKNSERTPEISKFDKILDVTERKIHNGLHEISKTENPKPIVPKKVTQDKDVKCDIKSIKKSPASAATSMVFDFRGKDVTPHVAVLPVPFGCKAPKKRSILVDGKEGPSSNGTLTDEDDEDFVDYSVPPPCGVIFEGENVKIGRGSILSTRNKELKIKFDDDVDGNTFIYPSESSLLEDSERSLSSPDTTVNETIPNDQHPPKLKTNTVIGTSSAGGLSTYTPSVLRTVDNFEPGMFRPPPPSPVLPEKEDEKHQNDSEEENTEVRENADDPDMLKPADPGLISSWSLSAGTSDLLF